MHDILNGNHSIGWQVPYLVCLCLFLHFECVASGHKGSSTKSPQSAKMGMEARLMLDTSRTCSHFFYFHSGANQISPISQLLRVHCRLEGKYKRQLVLYFQLQCVFSNLFEIAVLTFGIGLVYHAIILAAGFNIKISSPLRNLYDRADFIKVRLTSCC